MRKASISICPEGAGAIGFTAFSALLCAVLDWEILSVTFWLLCAFSLHFFRDPERVTPWQKDLAVSPADGTVIKMEKRPNPFDGREAMCISIFMSVFNVHVNRSPVAGTVTDIRYFPGKFFNASFDKASEDNERCAWRINGEDNSDWCMVQIAGLIARRIVCRAQVGEKLTRGERVGMIRFGSRVDLYLPSGYVPSVQTGMKVFGGQTVIAHKPA